MAEQVFVIESKTKCIACNGKGSLMFRAATLVFADGSTTEHSQGRELPCGHCRDGFIYTEVSLEDALKAIGK